MKDTTIRDKMGVEIKPNDIIVYGHLLSRSAGIKIGKVLKVGYAAVSEYSSSPKERITVQGIEDGWRGDKPALCKKGTLMFPDRIIVLKDDMIPEKYRVLLNTITI